MEKISWLDEDTNESLLKRGNEVNTKLYLAKETSMDWQYFETLRTFS